MKGKDFQSFRIFEVLSE